MHKKQFVALADHLRLAGHMPARIAGIFDNAGMTTIGYEGVKSALLSAVAEELADYCQSQNRAFNRERWLAYVNGECGPSGGKIKC